MSDRDDDTTASDTTASDTTGSESTVSDEVERTGVESAGTDSDGTEKAGGLGGEGTIPPNADGIAAGMGEESSNFNPEEDPEADTSSASDPN